MQIVLTYCIRVNLLSKTVLSVKTWLCILLQCVKISNLHEEVHKFKTDIMHTFC